MAYLGRFGQSAGCFTVRALLHRSIGQSSISTAGTAVKRQCYSQESSPRQFDEKLLQHLVCPLSKKDLRYDKEKNELVCDEVGVAYPIVNGIPNLVPQDARMLKKGSAQPDKKR